MGHIVVRSTAAEGHHPSYRQFSGASTAIIGSGCSTTDPIWANLGISGRNAMAWLAQEAMGVTSGYYVDKSSIPGSSMVWRKENASAAPNAWDVAGDYDVLLIGDNPDQLTKNRPEIVLEWAHKVWDTGGEMILWFPPVKTTGLPYPQQVAADLAIHEKWQDYCNERLPENTRRVRLIPGGIMGLRFQQDIDAGVAPSGFAFMMDDVHVNQGGEYAICVMVAASLWGIDPDIMPNNFGNRGVVPHAAYMRSVVKDVLAAYPRSGINTGGW